MFAFDKRYLPWSARRYQINGVGTVTDRTDREINPVLKDGIKCVDLEWILGKVVYPIALLVLIAFDKLAIPAHLFEEVIPLFRDGNENNFSPDNLLYKFKSGKLEVEDHPGFYYIPFHVNYAINEEGDLVNIETRKFKKWSVTPPGDKNQTGGYLYTRVVTDLGFSKTLFLHRALCLVFKDFGANVESIVVNHKDGRPSNNALNNLEWSTYRDNNIHALDNGLRGDNRPMFSKNLLTGEILWFRSLGECGRHYGQPQGGFIQHRLRHARDKVYPDMLLFKRDDGSDWPIIDLDEIEITRSGGLWDIQARNVFTGEIIIFTGAEAGVSLTGVKKGTIISHLTKDTVIPVNGWNFKWHSNYGETTWPVFTEKHLKIFAKFPNSAPDGAIVVNQETGEELFYESIAMACNALAIEKWLFYSYAKTGKLLKNKYKVKIFDIRKTLGLTME